MIVKYTEMVSGGDAESKWSHVWVENLTINGLVWIREEEEPTLSLKFLVQTTMLTMISLTEMGKECTKMVWRGNQEFGFGPSKSGMPKS